MCSFRVGLWLLVAFALLVDGAPNSCNKLMCSEDVSCEFATESCCLGRCVHFDDLPRLEHGDRCSPETPCLGMCAGGLECNEDSGTCEAGAALGCACNSEKDCISGFCGEEKTCLAKGLGVGAKCAEHAQCKSSLCSDGVCTGKSRASTCKDGECAAHLFCEHGRCIDAARINEECSESKPCDARLVCNDGQCINSFSLTVGKKCDSSRACNPQSYCDQQTGSCKKKGSVRPGNSCETTPECFPGYICEEKTKTCVSTLGEVCVPGEDLCNSECQCDPEVEAFVCQPASRLHPPGVVECVEEVNMIYTAFPDFVPVLFNPLSLQTTKTNSAAEQRGVDAVVRAVCCLAAAGGSHMRETYMSEVARYSALASFNCSTRSVTSLGEDVCRSDLTATDFMRVDDQPLHSSRLHGFAVVLAVSAPAALVALIGLVYTAAPIGDEGSRLFNKVTNYGATMRWSNRDYERV